MTVGELASGYDAYTGAEELNREITHAGRGTAAPTTTIFTTTFFCLKE
jgi:hypothetical protein